MSFASQVRQAGSERPALWDAGCSAGPPCHPLGPGSIKPRGQTRRRGVGSEGGGHPTRVSERQPTDPTAQGAETLSKPSTSSRPTPGGCTCPQERQEETAGLWWWWWGGHPSRGKEPPLQFPCRSLPRPVPRRPGPHPAARAPLLAAFPHHRSQSFMLISSRRP